MSNNYKEGWIQSVGAETPEKRGSKAMERWINHMWEQRAKEYFGKEYRGAPEDGLSEQAEYLRTRELKKKRQGKIESMRREIKR